MSPKSIDTTLWARFSQPVACVRARGEAESREVRAAIADAVVTAARWAAALGPERAAPADFWRALYQRTYAAELRVERSARADDLVGARRRPLRTSAARWPGGRRARLRRRRRGPARAGADASERAAAERRWLLRRRLGRPLNLLRLLKAAATFDNAADYVAWKIERHSGYRIEPSQFQRRHPVLAAPALYLKLRARGVLR